MTEFVQTPTMITLKLSLKLHQNDLFVDWQAKLNSAIFEQPGFISLEFHSPEKNEWLIVQRFAGPTAADGWKQSSAYLDPKNELQVLTSQDIEEIISDETTISNGVTEVIIAEVVPEKEAIYKKWSAKIHLCEAKFPGFRGVYVQSPVDVKGKYWITFLKFDKIENLDKWLNSSERQELLAESKSMISYLETHRVISPYAGWFASIAKTGETPPVWKQAMIILLVLFPIVMLEFKYLNPLLSNLNLSLGTFIGNAISVSLITFPMMPIAIYFLSWWLLVDNKHRKLVTVIGTLLLLVLYLLEIWIFW